MCNNLRQSEKTKSCKTDGWKLSESSPKDADEL